MSSITSEMETELESELAHEHEHEHEQEAEMEQEAFFNHLAAMADRGGESQALRRIGLAAARQALRSYRTTAPAIEGESEFENEQFFEMEAESNPLRPGQANALMEHMSHEAVAAESEQEAAEQFLPLIPLAAKLGAKLLPRLASKVVPHLTRGVSQVARSLFRNRATRPLLRALPNIGRRTVTHLARQAARGHHITPRGAVRVLARQTARTLGNPRRVVQAFRRSRAYDRRYHAAARRFVGPPSRRGQGYYRQGGYRWQGTRPARYGTYVQYPGYHSVPYPGQAPATPGYTGQPAPTYAVPSAPTYTIPPASGPWLPAMPVQPAVAPSACQCFQPVSCSSCGRSA